MTSAPTVELSIPTTDDPIAWALFWLDSALRCENFHWDCEQRDCAENALITANAVHNGVPDGDWLWIKLMDFCKARGFAPANFNDLFDIVKEARNLRGAP
jgi:hypothetical protein